MTRARPRSLLTQVALLSFGALLIAQFVSFWLFTVERAKSIRIAQRAEIVERVSGIAALLRQAPESERNRLLQAAASSSVRVAIASAPIVGDRQAEDLAQFCERAACSDEVRSSSLRVEEARVASQENGVFVPPSHRIPDRMIAAGFAPAELRLSLPLMDGSWLNVTARLARTAVLLPPQIFATTLLSLALLLAGLWFALRRVTQPLQQLAAAADGFGLDGAPPSLPATGPSEVRALADALGRMHERLSRMIGERTRMLAALGHDLRSPLTALRVRAEMVDDAETRERMIATLEEMQEMVDSTLAFARGVSAREPSENVDLALLLGDLADELSQHGPQIVSRPSAPVILRLRRVPIRRALRNLMENAQRYGGGGEVRLETNAGQALVVIDDWGPGIPDSQLEHVFEPFVRVEPSRSRETGGAGLGLAIARAILQAHGASVALSNRAERGLRTTVAFDLLIDRE
jgi:signal transduction histidine kinase